MRQRVVSGVILFCLAGCTAIAPVEKAPGAGEVGESGQIRPEARPESLNTTVRPVPAAARTVEEFDTTTVEERKEAVTEAAPASAETNLGVTIASLGSPAEPGFWLKTPLISSPAKGRVEYPKTGKSVAVDLIPLDGPKTAGSRMSLPAMRLIEAPLTELPEVRVFLVSG